MPPGPSSPRPGRARVEGWLLLRVDPATALPVIEVSLAEARRIDDPIAVAVGLRSLAYSRLLGGDLGGAVAAAGELLDDLLARGALANARLLVDVTAVLAYRSGHPAWPALTATVDALPITTLTASAARPGAAPGRCARRRSGATT